MRPGDQYANGDYQKRLVRGCNADVTLLDVRMPGVDGLAALHAILADNPAAKVVMLSTSDAEEDVYRAVSLGAKGDLLKESDLNRLLEAIGTGKAVKLIDASEDRPSDKAFYTVEASLP